MAKVYLESTDTTFSIHNNNTTIYGTSSLSDNVVIASGVANVVVASTIEKVDLSADISSYKFKQGFGSNLEVQDLSGNTIMTLSDVGGKQLSFNSTVANLTYASGVVSIDGTDISSTASTLTPSVSGSILNPTFYSNANATFGTLSTLSSEGVSSLASGEYWNSSLSTITYSFNDTLPSSYATYGTELTQGFTPLNQTQRDVIGLIAQEVNELLGITLQEVGTDGLIRFNIVDTNDLTTAGFAFLPGVSFDYSGDVFLSHQFNDISTPYDYSLTQGEGGWNTIVHEIGHAFGLEHPFEGTTILPTSLDDSAHTIMSYTNKYNTKFIFTLNQSDGSLSYSSSNIQSQLFSLYDVSALQAIYGVNETFNTADDVYTINYTDFQYQTIWDAGGNDTFDFSSNTGNTTLDLNSGSLNSIDEYTFNEIVQYYQNDVNNAFFDSRIESSLNDIYIKNELYTGLNNVGIANGVVIENVNSGSGDDTITDNEVDNIINTSSGNDSIYVGNGGYDTVDGGTGTDTLYVNLLQNDVTVEVFEGAYLLYSDNYAVKFDNIELIVFSDSSTTFSPDILIA